MPARKPGTEGTASAGMLLAALGFAGAGLWMAGVFGPTPELTRFPRPLALIAGWAIAAFFGLCFLVLLAERVRPGLFNRALTSRDEVDRH